jgi:hypothetical protein
VLDRFGPSFVTAQTNDLQAYPPARFREHPTAPQRPEVRLCAFAHRRSFGFIRLAMGGCAGSSLNGTRAEIDDQCGQYLGGDPLHQQDRGYAHAFIPRASPA